MTIMGDHPSGYLIVRPCQDAAAAAAGGCDIRGVRGRQPPTARPATHLTSPPPPHSPQPPSIFSFGGW
ncbi:hypothetical protein I4F81_000867 [Pyropia yezoensis]|uniref:Uncharacterized protein n=1 Tax=Pyropia yezoensis TaxID=2788 RepID=A0ACC3BK25_PYRYE|nr:hypothetical protein I4F81_000867 [Neopyropia yezoensis]